MIKVKYFPYQPHCFAFGGFDHQMLNTLDAVNQGGEVASKLNIWCRNNDFDILHLWGVGEHAFRIIDWCKKQDKGLIGTVLLPYYQGVVPKLSFIYHYFAKAERNLRYYYSSLDAVVVVNELQAEILNHYLKVPQNKIHVVPNVVNSVFFDSERNSDIFIEKYNVKDYVLCTGNICSRKNQVNLALACIEANLNLVIIGNVLDGEQDYGNKLYKLVKERPDILWIKELPNNSPEYLSAYMNCLVFALPSYSETQPISALEAVAMGKSILLQNRAYASQKYFSTGELCQTGSVLDIHSALKRSLNKRPIFNQTIFECRPESVGNMYQNIYKNL